MAERLRRTAARQPGRAVGVLAAVAVLGTALAAGWTDRLALSTDATPQAPLEIVASGELAANSPAFRVAVRTMRSQLSANPAVADVREGRRRARRSVTLIVRFDVGGRRRDAAIARIERGLDPGPLTLSFRGEAAAVRLAKDAAIDDLWLLLFALPVIALAAIATLGVRPGATALLAAAAAAALAALACELLAGAIDVSWLALVGAAGGGVLVTLQLCAMASTGAGSAALCTAALAGAAPFAATALLGVDYLTSLGLGGALAALLAAPASLLAGGAGETLGHRGSPAWSGIGDLLGWSSLIAILVGLLALALLAFSVAPVEELELAAIGVASTPAIETAWLAAAIGAAAVAVAALCAYGGGRTGLALAGALVFALPAAAAAGLLVATIQREWLEEPLDYVSGGVIQLGSLVAAVATVASVSAAQLVALAAAAGQAEAPGKPERVSESMGRFGPAVALSCLAGIAAGVALCFSSPVFVKEFGLGIAAGLALELAVVGVLLAPALLRLSPDRASRQ